jgi:predicted amino acid-binding ACT domain protein
MSRAGQRPAELATVIADAASIGGPAVSFTIMHRDRDHLLAPLVLPTQTGLACRETLAFDLPPAGFRLQTGFAESPASTMAGVGSLTPRPCPGGYAFEGVASLNPRFLYDSSRDHEFLLSVDENVWTPDCTDALLMTEVFAKVADAAADGAKAPILMLQSPVAPFRTALAHRSGEPPKISRGAAVRLSVGVDSDKSDARLELIAKVAGVAQEYGLRLHLADRRVGRVRGEWKEAVAAVAEVYQEKRRLARLPDVQPRHALLVTLVGPARVGSSASILKALADRRVGVLAVTVASLQELAFINLVVPLPPSDDGAPLTEDQRLLPASDGIEWLASRYGVDMESTDLPRAADYQMCSTGPFAWSADGAFENRPLWLRWESPVGEDTSLRVIDDVIEELLRAEIVEHAQLDYCRSRMTGNGRLCSAKVSVRLSADIDSDDLPDRLSVLCRSTQANVEWNLMRRDPTLHTVRLKVAWRERWLGRVNSTGVV